ncbi:hypothetical protein [Lactococcus lactis]
MRRKMRTKIISEASDWINTSSLVIYEDIFAGKLVCIGQTFGNQGRLAIYDTTGKCLSPWEKISPILLEGFARAEAESRPFLKAETFQMQWVNIHGQAQLFCWAEDKHPNRDCSKCYDSIFWQLNGTCSMSWGAWCDPDVNQDYLEAMKNKKGGNHP